VIVSHSLGSYLIFSALDMNQVADKATTVEQTRSELQEILKRTSLVVFFANQLRAMELAALD
jgi:RecA/RadA recombinase